MWNCARVLGLAVSVLASACTVDSPDADAGHEVADSAGITIVTSRLSAWGTDTALIQPEPLLRIGREGEAAYQFSRVASGLLLSDGNIAVIEASAGEIRVFSPSGELVSTHGGSGEGPGEFEGLTAMFEYAHDSLVAWDQRLRRATILPRDGGAARVVDGAPQGNYDVFGILDNGTLLLYSPGGSFRPDLSPGLQFVMTDIIALNPADGTMRTIARLPDRERLVTPGGDAPMTQPLRYAIHAASADGFYWATPDRYDIHLHDSNGNVRRILRRPVEPRAVEPSMIQEHIEMRLEQVRRMEGDDAVAATRQRLEEGPWGDVLPLFMDALVDRDDRLWVAASTWPSRDFPRRWSLFSEDGVWLGDVVAPERLRILDARGDTVLGVWSDELDVPYVQLHRLMLPR